MSHIEMSGVGRRHLADKLRIFSNPAPKHG